MRAKPLIKKNLSLFSVFFSKWNIEKMALKNAILNPYTDRFQCKIKKISSFKIAPSLSKALFTPLAFASA